MGFKLKSGNTSSFKDMGSSPVKQKDEFGKISKGKYPSLIQDVNPVEKDEKGLYTTSSGGLIGDLSPKEATSDTTRYPKGFSDWKGELKEGDYIDETTHEAWSGVDVESDPPAGEGQKATGKRKVYNKKTGKYEDYKSPAKVSDEAVVAAQAKLDKTELDFREPGWTKAARGTLEGVKKVLGSLGKGAS